MAKLPKPQEPAGPEENSEGMAAMKALFAERDRLSTAFPFDPAALKDHDAKIKIACMGYDHHEKFIEEEEPVLHFLAQKAASREPLALRLLLEPRHDCELYQAPKEENQLPVQFVSINGVGFRFPRGFSYQIPKSMKDLLKQGGVK